jgi:hypothetical protein
MTIAICLECGRMKAGAWTPCLACGYQPTGPEDLAKSLMLSDNCIATDKLEEFSARRQQGEPWNFNPELVDQFKARVAALIPMTPEGHPGPVENGPPEGSAARPKP